MATAKDSFGRLDILHSNAGVSESHFADRAPNHELPEEIWEAVIAINLKGVWLCSKYAAPLLAEAGGSVIVKRRLDQRDRRLPDERRLRAGGRRASSS